MSKSEVTVKCCALCVSGLLFYGIQIVLFLFCFKHLISEFYLELFWFAFCVIEAIISLLFYKEYKKTYFKKCKIEMIREFENQLSENITNVTSQDKRIILSKLIETIENI